MTELSYSCYSWLKTLLMALVWRNRNEVRSFCYLLLTVPSWTNRHYVFYGTSVVNFLLLSFHHFVKHTEKFKVLYSEHLVTCHWDSAIRLYLFTALYSSPYSHLCTHQSYFFMHFKVSCRHKITSVLNS